MAEVRRTWVLVCVVRVAIIWSSAWEPSEREPEEKRFTLTQKLLCTALHQNLYSQQLNSIQQQSGSVNRLKSVSKAVPVVTSNIFFFLFFLRGTKTLELNKLRGSERFFYSCIYMTSLRAGHGLRCHCRGGAHT